MKMKKVYAMLLVGVMALTTLAGCNTGGSTNEPAASEANETQAVEAEATDAVEADDVAEEAATGEKPFEGITITMLKDSDMTDDGINQVIALAKEKLGVEIEVEQRIGGADGDNIVKTRLASGDMADLCLYNSGSLLNALNPSEYFYDLSNEDFINTYDETYKATVTIDGAVYGVPAASTQAGAMLYYKPHYEELGLEIPKTWDEFLANCEALKAAGKTAMLGAFGDSWTAQVMFLGDHYNVQAANPNFAEEFEAGTAKYATTPEGVQSFQKLLDVLPYYNEDYLAATYDDGCEMLINGEATHWAMLTQVLSNIYGLYDEQVNDIGVFAIPGDTPDDTGLTAWLPTSIYINKNAENMEAVLAFAELYVSTEGLDAYASAVRPDGPYCIKGYELPEDAYDAVKDDMQAYFDAGKTCTALEFQTSVKGANAPAICQEVGSGQTTAAEAATAYDEDCKKQAVQLGLNWE